MLILVLELLVLVVVMIAAISMAGTLAAILAIAGAVALANLPDNGFDQFMIGVVVVGCLIACRLLLRGFWAARAREKAEDAKFRLEASRAKVRYHAK